MRLKDILSQRIGIREINEIVAQISHSISQKQELFELLSDDELGGYQAAWVFTHFSSHEIQFLADKQDAIINELLVSQHHGKRRLLLSLLWKLSIPDALRTDFLDFCLEHMIARDELPGVQSLCLKLAYRMCSEIPELLQEYKSMLDIMEPELLPISIRTTRKNIIKAINSKKTAKK